MRRSDTEDKTPDSSYKENIRYRAKRRRSIYASIDKEPLSWRLFTYALLAYACAAFWVGIYYWLRT